MSCENPGALWLLPVLLPLLLALGLWGWRAEKEIAETLHLDLRRRRRKHSERYLLAAGLVALLVGAMASPRVPRYSVVREGRAGEVALLVDVSPSMAARKDPDAPSRLERAQSIVLQLVDEMAALRDVKVSLHGFTSIARSHVPFVGPEDYPYLEVSTRRVLGISSVPGQGTSLGRPILQVVPKFSAGSAARLIILLSDGEPFIGLTRGLYDLEQEWIEEAVAEAHRERVRVITIGVGEPEGARIPISDGEGRFTQTYATLRGVDYVSYLDEELLAQIATRTGGRYFHEGSLQGLTSSVEESLSPGTPATVARELAGYRHLGHWLLIGALPLWLALARRHLLG